MTFLGIFFLNDIFLSFFIDRITCLCTEQKFLVRASFCDHHYNAKAMSPCIQKVITPNQVIGTNMLKSAILFFHLGNNYYGGHR